MVTNIHLSETEQTINNIVSTVIDFYFVLSIIIFHFYFILSEKVLKTFHLPYPNIKNGFEIIHV